MYPWHLCQTTTTTKKYIVINEEKKVIDREMCLFVLP